MAVPLISLLETDNYILEIRNKLLPLPRADPWRSTYLATLAPAQLVRYVQTYENEDLEESISLSVEAILLFDPNIGHGSDVVEAFFSLAHSLFHRSVKLKRLADSKHCLRYFRYLRDQSLQTSHITRDRITTGFTAALAIQVQMGSMDPMRNIEEMAILCRKLLRLDGPDGLLLSAAETLVGAINDEPFSDLRPPLDQAIEFLREANIRFPDLDRVSITLFLSLYWCFMSTHSHADYKDAMSIADGSFTDPESAKLPSSAAVLLAQYRFHIYGNPEYLEEAIYHIRVYLRMLSSEDPRRQRMTRVLEQLEKARFNDFSVAGNSQAADDAGDTEVNNRPSSSRVVPPLPIARPDIGELTPMMQDADVLDVLKTFSRLLDQPINRATIEEAMECHRRYLESPQPSDFFTSAINIGLARFLIRAFSYTDDMAHLNESITLLRDILKSPVKPLTSLQISLRLLSALRSRFLSSHEMVDFEEIMQLYPIAAADTHAKIPDRFRISCQWVGLARGCGHPSTSTAYESAISLMKDSLAFSPTLETQHSRLVSSLDNYDTLPLEYASHQIDIGQLEQAIETLERGRGLLWSEMRGLRMSTDQLRLVNLPLAERFAAINKDLEALTTSSSAGIWPNEGHADSDEPMDPFGRLVVKQRALVAECDKLISQIQSLPGFETFLMTPSFDTLRSAALHGPVIFINHTEWRSDILILLHDAPLSLIPTPDNFYERANQLKDQLLGARNHDLELESGAYDDALSSVLESLYDLVGLPVIQRLQELNIPEQSRIWFCPTSVFCSLPLHAMGPIRSDSEGRVKFYFSDLYIPSYTPMISALIESRKPRARPLDRPSMLLVIQPDAKMPKALQEMRVIQSVGLSTATLLWETATPSAVLEHLRYYPFVHVSCHGNLETGKPFNAFFKLYEGARLTLLDIVRSRLPTAEFAFLSACHTAEHTTDSIADEGLHLAGAVQYCGFRSVVGTMWEMADDDGPDLARDFYGLLFSNRWGEMPYCERTAEALRDAVKVLRGKRKTTLERWVNFVHYGA